MKTIVRTLVLAAALAAVAQEKPEQVSSERARTNFGRPITLASDDVRPFPDAPAGFDKPRNGKLSGRTEVFEYDSTRPAAELAPDPAAARERLQFLYLSCGNKDGLINISQGVHVYLKQHDVPHVWNVDGHGHDRETWANNLYHFAQRIFR